VPIIASLWTGTRRRVVAVTLPNRGFLPNVVDGAIVEVGALADGDGIHPETMPPVADAIAGHIATQVALQDLIVQAALTADRELAVRAVIEDPASPADEGACRAMFGELAGLQGAELPFA
jgi:alpha-galactosidase